MEFLESVQHDVNLRRSALVDALDHQQALTINTLRAIG
jgi:hypothetical protein